MHGLTVYSLGGVLVSWASLVFLTVAKNIPANEGDTGLSLGWGDSPEEEMATHFSIFAWKIHGQRSLAGYSPWGHRVGHG